jgi:putative heme-binding domain-containing protein
MMLARRLFLSLVAIGAIGSFTHVYGAGQNASPAGDVARGQAIFDGKGNCLSCHRAADQGSYMGPDLSAVGAARKLPDLRKAILDPNPEVTLGNRLYRIVTRDGKTVTGRLLNQDVYIAQMLTPTGLVTYKKADLREHNFTATPPMPSYRDKLTESEQNDLIAYLVSLKGVVKQ